MPWVFERGFVMQTEYPLPSEVRAMLLGMDVGAPSSRETRSTILDVTGQYPPPLSPIGHAARTSGDRCVYCGHNIDWPCICEAASPDGCNGGNHGKGFEYNGLPILSPTGQG